MKKYPDRVPLTKVDDYTDSLKFRNLGLPTAVDESKLTVNLNSFEFIRKVVGLGSIELVGVDGEAGEWKTQGGSLGMDGALSGAATRQRDKNPLTGDATVQFPTPDTFYDNPSVTIRANKSEMRERVQDEQRHYPKGPVDPALHARILDETLKSGIGKANVVANITAPVTTIGGL